MATAVHPLDEIVAAFGGPTAFLRRLGQRWPGIIEHWRRKHVPHYREHQFRGVAKQHGIALPADAMARIFPPKTETIQ